MSNEVKILAVDDDESTLNVLRKILESEHYEADMANSAREAFGKLRDDRYDAVLCDMWMPEMNGKAFYEYLEREFPGIQQKVIFMTGDVASEFTWDFIDGQNIPYVLKPFSRVQLVRQLRKTIGKNRGDASPQSDWVEREYWDGKNRRNRRRIATNSKVKIDTKDQVGSSQIGTMIDATLKGASFLSHRKYSVGTELQISYPYPNYGSLVQNGVVVSAEFAEEGFWRIAVAF